MANLSDMIIWEVERRIKYLDSFMQLARKYYQSKSQTPLRGIAMSQQSLKYREGLNSMCPRIIEIVRDSGESSLHEISFMNTGQTYVIELISNMFNFYQYRISCEALFDVLQRAKARYENERFRARIRSFNPLWWIWQLIGDIAWLPFMILTQLGADKEVLSRNPIVKLFKLMFQIIVSAGAFISALRIFGFSQQANALLRFMGFPGQP